MGHADGAFVHDTRIRSSVAVMVEVRFAKAFRRHVDCPVAMVAGCSLGEVLGSYFEIHPTVRGYVLDDVGAVRKHVTIFHNDELITDLHHLLRRTRRQMCCTCSSDVGHM